MCNSCSNSTTLASARPGQIQLPTVTSLWQALLCSKLGIEKFYAHKCLNGYYKGCVMQKLEFSEAELSQGPSDTFGRIVKVWVWNKHDKKGKKYRKLKCVPRRTRVEVLISFLKAELPKYVKHNFRAKWQDKQFKLCKANFLKGVFSVFNGFLSELCFPATSWSVEWILQYRADYLLCHVTWNPSCYKCWNRRKNCKRLVEDYFMVVELLHILRVLTI